MARLMSGSGIATLKRMALGVLAAAGLAAGAARSEVLVVLDPSQQYQTIHGWEATANLIWEDDLEGLRDQVFDRLLDDVGITRIRLEVYAGAENTDHSFRRFLAGSISEKDWSRRRFVTINDDADPQHINPAGFDFSDLDWRVDNVVLPLMERARARGKRLDINLNYVAFTSQSRGGAYIHTDPEEYGEFILAVWLHLRDKYGFVPDMLEPVLEPDLVKEWSPDKLGRAMVAAAQRLRGAGFVPRLIAPSVTNAANAIPWFDGIAQVPGATEDMYELSFHRYRGASLENLRAIAARAKQAGIPTSMLEFWGGKGTYNLLHTDLALANASAWQGRAVMGYYHRDRSLPAGKQLVMNDDIRYNALYFHNILPGAVRFAASSTNAAQINPLAFRNPDGGETVVLRSEAPTTVTIHGLSASAYYIAESTMNGTTLSTQPTKLGANGRLTVQVSGRGVLAVTTVPPAQGF